MEVRLNINDDIEVWIDEKREDVLQKLDTGNIKYNIMYDKENDKGIKETIINVTDCDIEIHLNNDRVYAIAGYNNKYTNIVDKQEEINSPLVFVNKVKDRIKELANKDVTIDIEKLDLASMNCRFILRADENYKVNLSKDGQGNIYMHKIRKLYA